METIVIRSINGSILFEYECENNSIKKSLIEAIKSGADLRKANLHKAELNDVDFSGANLFGVDLRGAELCRANLSGTYLVDADLRDSDLYGANLSDANMNYANLSNADLCEANLSGADLYETNLMGADLCGANLGEAILGDANLGGANLQRARNLKFAQLSFDMHGEMGRMLTAIKTEEGIKLFCGCFKGSPEDLSYYIENDKKGYKKSRRFALDTVLSLINYEE